MASVRQSRRYPTKWLVRETEKNHNSSRQDEIALSSVIQSAELKKWYILGDLLQKILEFRTAKIYKYAGLKKTQRYAHGTHCACH